MLVGVLDGTHSAIRRAKIEGGSIYNLTGGPLSNSNRTTLNDIYIHQTGGEIDVVTAGAGTSATYGNRIVALTGGKVNYSAFGGSNGNGGTGSNDARVNGASFVYVGGDAQIGDATLVANGTKIYTTVEAGSVFGIGNGRSGVEGAGSNDNSNVIIDGNARILGNVYGGRQLWCYRSCCYCKYKCN